MASRDEKTPPPSTTKTTTETTTTTVGPTNHVDGTEENHPHRFYITH